MDLLLNFQTNSSKTIVGYMSERHLQKKKYITFCAKTSARWLKCISKKKNLTPYIEHRQLLSMNQNMIPEVAIQEHEHTRDYFILHEIKKQNVYKK